MNAFLRRLAATLSLASLALSWPLAFVSAQSAPATEPTPIAIIGDSQNEGFVGYNALPPLLNGYRVVGSQCNRSWTVAQLHNGGGASGSSASCFRNQSSISFLNGLSPKPKAIIVFAGGGGTDTAAGLQAFVADLKEIAPVVIWVGPFHSKTASVMARHTANSQTQKNTLPGLGVNWIEAIAINPSFTYSDGTHFTASEYREISTQLAPQILQYLAAASSANPAAAPAASAEPVITPTDALGRSSEEVQARLAAQCADTNPAFPVRLGVGIGGTTEVNGLTEYINVVYRYMTAIVLVVAIVMVTYGGFRYLLAASPIGVKDGKDIIKNAIVGMVLVLSAYVILNTINPATTILQFTQPPADITCIPFESTIGTGGTDRRNTQSTCATDADCSTGQKCLETLFVRSDAERRSFWSSSLFGEDGEPTGLSSGQTIKECSDGKFLAPCGTDDDCKGESGLICETNSWKVCIKTENNPVGSPCNANNQCVAVSGDRDCASGYRNAGTVVEDAFTPNSDHDFALCRGQTERLSADAVIEAGWSVPQSARCNIQPDCEDPLLGGADRICTGPAGLDAKVCVIPQTIIDDLPAQGMPELLSDQPCFRTPQGIYPTQCATGGRKCVFCKGGKVTTLSATTDPASRYVGACVNESSLFGIETGDDCTGGAP